MAHYIDCALNIYWYINFCRYKEYFQKDIVILIKKMFAHFVRNVICILVTIFLFLKIGSSCYKLYEIMCTSLDKDRACQEYSDIILLFGFFFACFFPYIPYIYFLQPILLLFVFCFLFCFLWYVGLIHFIWCGKSFFPKESKHFLQLLHERDF